MKDNVFIITGAGSGIGRATAYKLAKSGMKIVCADYNEITAKETADKIENDGGQAAYYKADVSKPEEVKALVDFAVDKYKTLNGIFNNAGIGFMKPFLEMDPETYHKVINVNQHGVYYGMYYAGRKMVELGTTGTIVNTASVFAFSVSKGTFNYHAAKAAVVAMTKAGGLELAPYNIRVVGVAPGGIDTPILGDNEDFKQIVAKCHMRGHLIKPDDVAEAVCFLLSPAAWAINGSIIPVDDGFLSFK